MIQLLINNLAKKALNTLAILLLLSATSLAVTVTNGSFEAVQITSAYSQNLADIPGWTHSGDVGDALLWRAGPQCCGGANMAKAGDGSQFVTMGGGFGPTGSSSWSQVIGGLTVGQTYIVNFMIAAEGETPTQQVTLGFTNGSLTAPQIFTTPVTNTLFWQDWGSYQYSFVAANASATLQFSVSNQAYDVGLDAVSVSAPASSVPEPIALPCAAVALIILTILKKRR